jgi:hypothetical protein
MWMSYELFVTILYFLFRAYKILTQNINNFYLIQNNIILRNVEPANFPTL